MKSFLMTLAHVMTGAALGAYMSMIALVIYGRYDDATYTLLWSSLFAFLAYYSAVFGRMIRPKEEAGDE